MELRLVKRQLDEVSEELIKVEEERQALLALKQGLEAWLRVRGEMPKKPLREAPPQLELLSATAKAKANAEKGLPSARGSVLKAIKDAQGEPMHTSAILAVIRVMGAVVREDDPERMIDLMGYSLKKSNYPIEKCGARTWRWAGPNDELTGKQEGSG